MAVRTEQGIPLSALCPKFLHTNSTSHTWPFSAIAELIDNAYDPDVNAKQFWIDKTLIKEMECLTFTDNGNGMSHDTIHKMLSFGFSDKQAINGHVPVGMYGNGFKSGSMRLGKDALVFTKNGKTMSIGLLSQTFLEATKAENIVVPIVTFCQNRRLVTQDSRASLDAILQHSLFRTERELTAELDAVMGKHGTRIIIWNLRKMSNGKMEFDFDTDKYDIRIPADVLDNSSEKYKKQERHEQSVPESDYSLRAYCSILYLKPRMLVILRGQKVKTQLISKSLAFIAKDNYKPSFLNNKSVRITFGYNTKSKEQYGILMYHKNRLIKAYERVGCQLKANNMGVGVVGVIECNFLKPTHNKQDFDYTDEYRKTIYNLGIKLAEYWNEIRYKRTKDDPNNTVPVEDTEKRPDQNWVQCDECLKWRKLPDGINPASLPDKWYCRMNPDTQFRSCQVEEEPEDDDAQPTYDKTYKRQERYNKMRQEKSKQQQQEEEKRKAEMQIMYSKIEKQLQKDHEVLKRQLRENNFQVTLPHQVSSPPATPPARNNGMPMITNVRSLSSEGARTKRTLPLEPSSSEVKKPKTNGVHNGAVSAEPGDVDMDLVIVEDKSTPKPKTAFDLAKVKVERRSSTEQTGMRMECSSDAAPESPTETPAAAPSTSPAPLGDRQSAETQTDVKPVLKQPDHPPGGVAVAGKPQGEGPASDSVARLQGELARAQAQQDELMGLMHTTAKERDAYKDETHKLTCQVVDLEKEVQELTQKLMKKEVCHQATETDWQGVGGGVTPAPGSDSCQAGLGELQRDYEQLQKELQELRKKWDTLQATKSACSDCSSPNDDDLILQVDSLLRDLDRCGGERDEYKRKVEVLETEKARILSEREELKKAVDDLTCKMERQAENGACSSSTDGEPSPSAEDSWRLRSLRMSIGKLLVTFVPALDLEQVNYESDVIDEILDQVLDQVTLCSST
nr:PREDICTED: MORC family CW-type zinc finger protein 3 isoform X1 [Lepisosteus oculatus]